MTEQERYEALLENLNEEIDWLNSELEPAKGYSLFVVAEITVNLKLRNALRAVVEFHKPIGDGKFEPPYCQECLSFVEDASSPNHADWPCNTFIKVEEALA